MTTRYVPIPNNDVDELDAAFAGDDDDEHHDFPHSPLRRPGAYDFERDYSYDHPPPGSPLHPSDRARPNDIGNSNGRIPTSPIPTSPQRPSFIRRAAGALLPQYYTRVSTSDSHHPVGGGIENDGVFANVMAKPQPQRTITAENGDVYLVPEETLLRENLPSYDDARADAVPPYWETVVHAPSDPSSILVDDLPAGSVIIFILNILVSYLFQFIGFFLTYILHTSHAAKYGSRVGLGLTLIQYALYSRTALLEDDTQLGKDKLPPVLNDTDPNPKAPVPVDGIAFTSKDWLSILLMTIGLSLRISAMPHA
ncbi:hypothetical protein F5887DRAFT_947861 [Amanita rubescens]|nr:hypothetical protein F5887DRAFT_947861 [Amanita rubescens]